MSTQLDLVAIGRVSVDLYGQQIGGRLEDAATFAKAVGGCPANVAIGAARLGLKSALITRVGDEPMGRFVREELAREGVATHGVHTDHARLTALVLLSVRDEHSFPLIFYRENCADSALCEDDIDPALIRAARAVLVTGTHFSLLGGMRAQRKAIDIAKANRARVVLDIDYRPNLWGIGGHDAGESRYARSTIVTQALAPVLPNCDLIVGTEEELHIAAGVESTIEAVRRIRAASAAVIVCKRGADGCVVFAGDIPATLEAGLVVPGERVEIYNVLGAGDAFLAGFLQGYLRDVPHEESARRANACGAFAVSRLLCSAEFPTLPELEYYLAKGSACYALRQDEQLNHLHRVTTRRPAPSGVYAAELPRRGDAAGAVLDALGRAGAAVAGCGVLMDGAHGALALGDAQRRGLWVAGTVAFEPADSLASRLLEWPTGVVAACRLRYLPSEEPERRLSQEDDLLRAAAACRAQGRELLIGITAGGDEPRAAASLASALARVYELGVRPDWWELEAAQNGRSPMWESCAAVIAANDEYCRGILVRVQGPLAEAAALLAAVKSPWVRGFIGGDSIFSSVPEVAERFQTLLAAWVAHRSSS